MKLAEFDYVLPDELVALRPARPRSSARLLVAQGDALSDRRVTDLPEVLRPGDRLVLNDTRVIPARLVGKRQRRDATARIEMTLMEPRPDGQWRVLVKPLRKVMPGESVTFPGGLSARLVSRSDNDAVVSFDRSGAAFEAALAASGAMPLPPYIAARRSADLQDRTDYQTIWARAPGAVAAPTASLHFDAALMDALAARGVEFTRVTLHVGAGTFLPVKVDDIDDHRMHAERGEITREAAAEIAATRAAGGRIIPVGTTALRLIETAANDDGTVAAWTGATDIFIRPGFRFRAADALVTNFHQPRSTLLMLVSAFIGHHRLRRLYRHALEERYRFLSYGDASILFPND